MSTRSRITTIMPAVALVAAGVASVAPAQAATTYVTASTAGTKAVKADTYMWGSTNAAPGSKICSQVRLPAGWATSQCSSVKANHSYAVKLTYGSNTVGTYTFRAVAGGVASHPVTLRRVSSSTSPGTVVYQGGVLGTAYTAYSGYNGVKVYLALKAMGYHPGPLDSTLNSTNTQRLIAFQRQHGLPGNGVLDQRTWNALHTGYPFAIDSWAKTSDVMDNASRDVKVAAMVNFAKAQLNKPYIWGGTGPMGFDCSGLLLQAARAGGMKPTGVYNRIDELPDSDLANHMWGDREFQRGSLSGLRVGDFIYYGSGNTAHHVAMYVGGNTVINALNNRDYIKGSVVQYSSLSNTFGWRKLGVNRAFAL